MKERFWSGIGALSYLGGLFALSFLLVTYPTTVIPLALGGLILYALWK